MHQPVPRPLPAHTQGNVTQINAYIHASSGIWTHDLSHGAVKRFAWQMMAIMTLPEGISCSREITHLDVDYDELLYESCIGNGYRVAQPTWRWYNSCELTVLFSAYANSRPKANNSAQSAETTVQELAGSQVRQEGHYAVGIKWMHKLVSTLMITKHVKRNTYIVTRKQRKAGTEGICALEVAHDACRSTPGSRDKFHEPECLPLLAIEVITCVIAVREVT
jgi:hypothetical protein